jgi:predicted transcriptional regulator
MKTCGHHGKIRRYTGLSAMRGKDTSRILVKEVMIVDIVAVKPDVDLTKQRSYCRITGSACRGGQRKPGDRVISEADLPLGMKKGHTFQDVLRRIAGEPTRVRPASGDRVGDVMSAPALTIRPEESIGSAAALMNERRIKRLPVVGAEGKMVGIVSRADIVRAIGRP